VRLDLRGAGDGVARAPSVYHAGLTEDPRIALEELARDPRVSSIALVGISLGGHVSLKLAGELGHAAPLALRAVVSISAPVDIGSATDEIDRLRNIPYCAYVLYGLVKQAHEFARLHPEKTRFDASRLFRLRKVREYHDRVIAPMHGFRDADDYHTRASAAPHLARIAKPTLMIHAKDDPMVPLKIVAPFLEGASPQLTFLPSAAGGHVGWLGGFGEDAWVHTWSMDRTIEFLRRHT
jgi:predicted alpha/beta-fold hydrolase